MIDGVTPLEWFRVTFIYDLLSCFMIYAISWPLGANKLIGSFLKKAL